MCRSWTKIRTFAGVSATHSYVVEAAVVAQGELAVAVDAVVADAVDAAVQAFLPHDFVEAGCLHRFLKKWFLG